MIINLNQSFSCFYKKYSLINSINYFLKMLYLFVYYFQNKRIGQRDIYNEFLCFLIKSYNIFIIEMRTSSRKEQFRRLIQEKERSNFFQEIRRKKNLSINFQFELIYENQWKLMRKYLTKTLASTISCINSNKSIQALDLIHQCELATSKNTNLMSYALMMGLRKQKSRILDYLSNILINSIEKCSYGEAYEFQSLPLSPQNAFLIFESMLKFLSKIQWHKFRREKGEIFLNSFSALLSPQKISNLFNFFPQKQIILHSIITNYCFILHNLLENPLNHFKFQYLLKQYKIPSLICAFIDLCQDNLLIEQYMVILKTIKMLLKESHENDLLVLIQMYSRSTYTGEKVNFGILDKMYQFCIKFARNISMKNKPIVMQAFQGINQIIKEGAISLYCINTQDLLFFISLLNSENRQMSLHALSIIQQLSSFEVGCPEQKSYIDIDLKIIDQIHEKLKKQENMYECDPFTRQSLLLCRSILSNCLYLNIQNRALILQHPIWIYLYNCIQEKNPILAVIPVFNDYIQILGPQRHIQILPCYIQALSQLNLNSYQMQTQNLEKIKKSLRQLHEKIMNFCPRQLKQNFQNILYNYDLDFLIFNTA